MKVILLACVTLFIARPLLADAQLAADAVNQFGIDLHRHIAKEQAGQNSLISPWSLHAALAMASAGADGETRAEMTRGLHLPPDSEKIHPALADLARAMMDAMAANRNYAERVSRPQGNFPLLSSVEEKHLPGLNMANRLYGQAGMDFRPEFLALLANSYRAPLSRLDFVAQPERARKEINEWVLQQTQGRISNLLPNGAITTNSRVVLANALFFKSAWSTEFSKEFTKPRPFMVGGREKTLVPTIRESFKTGYRQYSDFEVVAMEYFGNLFQFVVILPTSGGLQKVEARVDGKLLRECAQLPTAKVILELPTFRMQPSAALRPALSTLGMAKMFDARPGGADFSRMASAAAFYVDDVFHQTFISVNEQGTEAAAATAIIALSASAEPRNEPVTVRVDRPFLFAIQHIPTATCLFLGRVVDPR